MEVVFKIADGVSRLPDAVSLCLCPALLVLCTILLLLVKGKRFYLPVAVFLGAVELFFAVCEGDGRGAAAIASLYVALAAILWMLFYVKLPKCNRRSKADKMYEKFHLDLEPTSAPLPKKSYPPKVCCFDEEETRNAEDGTLRLKHASDLLEKLLSAKLSASDRLEADTLSHRLDGYRDRALSEGELRSLNDCLASILKLTAKYQL